MTLARACYECMFLLDSNSYARDPGGSAQKVLTLIESSGGKILASRLWNEQRLAYPIKGHRKGVYWLVYFDLEAADMPKFNRACQLADQVLRFLTIRLEPRLVDAMVSAAKGERERALPVPDGMVSSNSETTLAEVDDPEVVKT